MALAVCEFGTDLHKFWIFPLAQAFELVKGFGLFDSKETASAVDHFRFTSDCVSAILISTNMASEDLVSHDISMDENLQSLQSAPHVSEEETAPAVLEDIATATQAMALEFAIGTPPPGIAAQAAEAAPPAP